MSLENKLSKISNEIKREKEEKRRKLEEEQLLPFRLKRKELEKTKYDLELMLNSLKLKSDVKSEIGIGMKEHSQITESKFKDEDKKLENIMNKYKEALKVMGIENKEQLLENEDFSKDEEIVSYKEAQKAKNDLELSDSAFREKLSSLGINIDQKDFSYDLAEKLLNEKIEQINNELILVKAETPEGREELKKELFEYFNKKLKTFSFYRDKNFRYTERKYILEMNNEIIAKFNKSFIVDKYIFHDFILTLLKDVEKKYPYNLVREVVKEVFREKINNAEYFLLDRSRPYDNDEIEDFRKIILSSFLPMAEKEIETLLRKRELSYKAKAQGLEADTIESLASIIRSYEYSKKEAQEILYFIEDIENKLSPDEKVVFNGKSILFPKAEEEYYKFREEFEKNLKRLKDVNFKIREMEYNKPKIFGKSRWRENLDNLKKEKEELEKKTDLKWRDQECNRLWSKTYISIVNKDLHFTLPKVEGKVSDVLSFLKEKLNEIINKEVPEPVIKLYNEFSDLVEKNKK